MLNDIRTYLPILLIFYCLLPSILIAIIAFFAFRRLTKYVSPDVGKLQHQLEKMRAKNPNAKHEDLVQKIIRQQSFKCGLIGAVTSIGGFFTLPIALPVDIFLSLQVQNTMVDFIAASYGKTQVSTVEEKLRNYIVLSGGIRATETTTTLILKMFTRVLEKSFSKLIPFIGAAIGFGVNYAIAQGTGRLAVQWYSGRLAKTLPLPRNS